MNFSLTRNILTTLTARVIVLALALLSSIILARVLGPDGRGLLALTMMLPTLACTVGLLGYEQANAVHAGLDPARRRALAWHSLVTAVVVGSVMALAGVTYILAGAPGFESHLSGPTWLYILPILLVPVRLLNDYWSAAVRGMNKIFAINILEVATKVVSLAVVIVLVLVCQTGVAGAVCGDALVIVGTVITLAVMLTQSQALGRPTFDRVLWNRTSRYALMAYPGTVMTFLNYRLDQFIIAFLLPLDQLAFYVLAVEIAERLWIVPGAVQMALLPHLTNSPKRDPALAAVIARHAIAWMSLACLVVLILAGVAIEFIYSTAFAEAAAPLRWLLPGIFMMTVSKVVVTELAAREKIGFTVWLMVLGAAVNAGINVLLIPQLGIVGAAIASSVSYSLVALVITHYYLRETHLPWSMLIPRRTDLALYASLLRRRQSRPAEAPAAAMSATEPLR